MSPLVILAFEFKSVNVQSENRVNSIYQYLITLYNYLSYMGILRELISVPDNALPVFTDNVEESITSLPISRYYYY